MDNALSAIRELVGDEHCRPAAAADSIDGVAPSCVAEPPSAAALAQVLKFCDQAGLRVVTRGSGTKLDWGNPPTAADVILSTRRLNQVLEHAAGDMTATVQAGCTVAALANTLAERGQRWAVDPLWPDRATIGGTIAADDNGTLRAAFGTIRDSLIGITVALPDGTLARSGGKVVKNVAGYDLPKLFAGSFGTLGVITQAIFRLYPLPKSTRALMLTIPTTEALGRLISDLADNSQVAASVQIEAEDTAAAPIRVYVRVEALPGAMEEKVRRVFQAAADCGARPGEPPIESPADPWAARENLFSRPDSAVAKVSLLSASWPAFIERLRDRGAAVPFRWNLVAQAVGVGLLRLGVSDRALLGGAIESVRAEAANLGGCVVVLRSPPELKARIDVWPAGGNALPLMRRVKQQFDPRGTLSPGRFVGGI